jgi:hypothetical protein
VTAMGITIHSTLLPHDDPDASLAFYRDRAEMARWSSFSCGLGSVKTNGQRRNRHPG